MKSTTTLIALLYLCSLLELGSGDHLSNILSSNSLHRKPFISPEQPAVLQNFRRIKREITASSQNIQQFQDFLIEAKETCAKDMGFDPSEVQKSLLLEEQPTPREKCLIECILKRIEIMDTSNKLSTRSIGHIADMISNNNALVISIAMATADNCNREIKSQDPCDIAHEISKCIAQEMKAHKVNIMY